MNDTTHASDALAAAEDLQAFVDRLAYVRRYMTAGEQAAFDVLTAYPYRRADVHVDDWAPIPDHAIKLDDDYPVLPERLTEIDGKPYVRCFDHGLIPLDHDCGATLGDHRCREAAHPNQPLGQEHDDQMTPHREWANDLEGRLADIRDVHVKDVSEGGTTSDGCKECGLGWPCPTFHFASGWGEMHACLDAGWCEHAGEKVSADEMGYMDERAPASGEMTP